MSEIPYIAEIAKFGVVGIMLALALWRLYHVEKALAESNAARVADLKENTELAKGHILSTTNWVNANDARTRVWEASLIAQEKIVGALQSLVKDNEQLRGQADRLIDSHQKLREALSSKGAVL